MNQFLQAMVLVVLLPEVMLPPPLPLQDLLPFPHLSSHPFHHLGRAWGRTELSGHYDGTYRGRSGCHILHSGNSAWPRQSFSYREGKERRLADGNYTGLRGVKGEGTKTLVRMEAPRIHQLCRVGQAYFLLGALVQSEGL